MLINEMQTKTESLPRYFAYVFLVFWFYLIQNVLTSIQTTTQNNTTYSLLTLGISLLVMPFIFAGVIGGIHQQQRNQEISSISAFFKGGKAHYWRILAASLLSYGLILLSGVIISMIIFSTSGGEELADSRLETIMAILDVPYSAMTLFWFTAIVVERKFFAGLWHAIKTLFTSPAAMVIAIGWAAVRYMDNEIPGLLGGQASVALDAALAGLLAVCRVLVSVLSLVVFKKARGYSLESSNDEPLAAGESSTSPGDGLVKASFGFTFVSFIPLLHIVALVLGVLALKRKKQFMMRPAIACVAGGFFTIFYLLLIGGLAAKALTPVSTPDYRFLSETNSDVESYVAQLEQGAYLDVQQQINQDIVSSADYPWSIDTVSALAKFNSYDLEGALADFKAAAAKEPDRGEFYLHYGIALLENDQPSDAAVQFEKALAIEPENVYARRYLTLVDDAYNPSTFVSAVLFMLILLLMFTVHEYGHAFAAWKMGDDTAKDMGRLTLNPIAHLDLFGSILLPVILLIQQSTFMFGWAKPVPVNPSNFKNPSKDHMVVSFAGPAVNLLVAMICFIFFGVTLLTLRLFWPETLSLNLAAPFAATSLVGPPFAKWLTIILYDIKQLFYTSLILGVFNLIPIPPLDGSWIFSGILPMKLREFFEKTRKYSFLFFIILVVTPVLDYILMVPLSAAWGALQVLVSTMGLG